MLKDLGMTCELLIANKLVYLKTEIMSSFKDKAKGNWNEIKGKIKEEYAEVTEDDLLFEEAQEDQLIGIIQKKTGKAKEEVKSFIDSL